MKHFKCIILNFYNCHVRETLLLHITIKERDPKRSVGLSDIKACLVAQWVKNLPAMWETWVPSLGCEDPLEKGKATHSSILGLQNSMDCIGHGVSTG